MGKVSKLARSALASHNLFIDFLNVSVLSDTAVYSAIPYEKIKAYMFLKRSLASLARAYKLHVYVFFYVGTFGGLPPPPPIPKSFRSPEEWPNEDGRFRPPHSLHEIAATGSDCINFKTFAFLAIYSSIWTSLYNTDIKVQQFCKPILHNVNECL